MLEALERIAAWDDTTAAACATELATELVNAPGGGSAAPGGGSVLWHPTAVRLAGPDGGMGVLLGRAFPGDAPLPDGSRIVMLQLLTPEEHAWVSGVPDASRARALVAELDRAGRAHLSSAHRPSFVPR